MKTIRFFLSDNFHFLVVKFSVYLNRRVFVKVFEHVKNRSTTRWKQEVKRTCLNGITRLGTHQVKSNQRAAMFIDHFLSF